MASLLTEETKIWYNSSLLMPKKILIQKKKKKWINKLRNLGMRVPNRKIK